MGELMKDHRQDTKTPRTAKTILSFFLGAPLGIRNADTRDKGILGVLAVNPFAFPMKGLP
jgi:hypothetical protein